MTHPKDLTKREWYAGMAMQGMIISKTYERFLVEDIVRGAFEYADKLIAEGRKEGRNRIWKRSIK